MFNLNSKGNNEYKYVTLFFRIIKNYLTYFIKIRTWNLLGHNTYAKIFKRHVIKHPNKIAFKHEDSSWRYIEVNTTMIINIYIYNNYIIYFLIDTYVISLTKIPIKSILIFCIFI